MDNNNKEVTPREFKVGDIVWDCTRSGKGKVTDITNGNFCVCVVFENGDRETYDSKGYFDTEYELQTLYHQPYKIELLEAPEELPEVGTVVYVWDELDRECEVQFFIKKEEELYVTTASLPDRLGRTYWDNMSLTLPDKFK